ncbi:hypothetical protein RCH16_003668 [Cryobacterium sp. MP_M5]|uniref:S1 family peptidase n=1 Tax=unclassified Cryobacterium TaxID=2649013 RepID=UPI0018CAD367|nr:MULTISPECIES: S1 family peptidase [unclassified Cryobacterium]MBG6060189.1 hypothetical protein [Cryobacterium sp. MP_M3]MEC5178628.1 hypothetical protein [Cryobacterium sp. MP_M5]
MSRKHIGQRSAYVYLRSSLIAAVSIAMLAGTSPALAQPSRPVPVASSGSNTPLETPPAGADSAAEEAKWEILRPAADAIAAVTVAYPNDFAYSTFTNDGFVAAFAADAPEEAVAILDGPGVPFELIENVGYSSAQLEEDVLGLTDQVVELTNGEVPFGISAVPESGAFDVTLYGTDQLASRMRSSDPLDELESSSDELESSSGLKINVTTVESVPATTGHGRHGGTWLTLSGLPQCTGGFVAKSTSSSDLGLITAGHCTGDLSYWNQANGDTFGLTRGTGTLGSTGDARFFRSPVMMDAWFLADTNVGRAVLDARNPVGGERVCRYGAKTQVALCGNIIAVTTAYYVNGQSIGGVASARLWNAKGDSGGPVYGGNTAMGVMSGTLFNGDVPDTSANRMLWFTKIDNAEAITGTKVCLDPVCR